jgi:hypothetical protein
VRVRKKWPEVWQVRLESDAMPRGGCYLSEGYQKAAMARRMAIVWQKRLQDMDIDCEAL